MSSGWHWYIILGTLLSLVWILWLLIANRKTSGNETTGHEWDGIEELDTPLPMWWIGMFVGSIVFMLLYLVYYPGLGNFAGAGDWSSADQHDRQTQQHDARFASLYEELAASDPEVLTNDRRAMQVGRRLFINHCSTCHGVNANGSFGFPNLTDDQWIWGGDFQAIRTTLTNGRMAQMPAWGPALGDQGIADLTQYVLQLAGREHDASRATQGATQFNVMCVACHGSEGHGNPVLGVPDLTNDIWLYGGGVDQITFTIQNGRQGNMPAQADILDENKIHILAAYVGSLSK